MRSRLDRQRDPEGLSAAGPVGPGFRAVRRFLVQWTGVLLSVAFAGCNYSFVAGSFPPPHVQSVAIEPFENETTRFELTGELYDQLLRRLPSALGVRTAGADVADAIVRGSITRYDVVAPNYRAGQPGQAAAVLQRQVNISVRVEIVDLVENVILWESTNVTARGEYAEGSPEDGGRLRAIELLVQEIVDGAQSNW
jgi:hypothetical protein